MTDIFTTKKLEKIIHKKIENNDILSENTLGNWNATVFYVAKKKCLLFVNVETFFSVIIPRFSMKDIDKIDELFINCFYNQLLFENINIEFKTISSKIGKVRFHSTNNNRKVTGIINYLPICRLSRSRSHSARGRNCNRSMEPKVGCS